MKNYLTIFTLSDDFLSTLQEGLDALFVAAGFYDQSHALFLPEAQWLLQEDMAAFSEDARKLIMQFRALPVYEIKIYITPHPPLRVDLSHKERGEKTALAKSFNPTQFNPIILLPNEMMPFIRSQNCVWTC